MAKDDISEVAWRQRYLVLLQKVSSGDTLSKSELTELRKYERLSEKSKSKKKPLIIDRKPTDRSRKSKKKKAKGKSNSSPVSPADVKLLGLECDSLTEADAALKTEVSLSELFIKFPKLRKAWDRGRLLRNLRDFARTGTSISAAAKKLKYNNGQQLREIIDGDSELSDLWEQTNLELHFEIRSAIIEEAKQGNLKALKTVDGLLSQDEEIKSVDFSHVSVQELADLTCKSRKTIYEWFGKGLPRNEDKTVDLSIFLTWYENYLIQRNGKGIKDFSSSTDPLRSIRAEKLRVELNKHRNQLLDRDEVIMGQIAWVQNILDFCKKGVESLARMCVSQPREKIIEILKVFFSDLHGESSKVPHELKLPEEKEKQLREFLLSLKPHDKKDDT